MRSSVIRFILFWCFLLIFSVSIFPQNISSVRSLHQPYKGGEANTPNLQRDQATIELDDGVNYDAIGLTSGGTFEVSAQFTSAQTAQYTGWDLIQVQIYINDIPSPAVLKIYDAGTTTNPGALLYSAPFTPVASSWQTITLTTPVEITGGDIWIGYEVTHSSGFYPAGCDAGPAVPGGDWIYNGGVWSQLHVVAPNLNYNWNIAGIVEGVVLGPGLATDPVPADGAIDVDINQDISWTNPAGATSIEVFWGTDPGNLTSVYAGSPVASYEPGPLNYSTHYYWKIDETDGTGTTHGTTWSFITMQDPDIVTLFFDDFESNTPPSINGWVITNDGGTLDWRTFGVPYPNSYTLPCGSACGIVFSADADEGSTGSTTLLSTATIDQTFDATQYESASVEFDNDFNVIDADDYAYVEVSNDNGTTWNIVWQYGGTTTDLSNTHEVVDISSYAGLNNFQVRFRSVQPGWDWWWTIDNVEIKVWQIVPVELTSFVADVNDGMVVLNWTTATETNNKGFEVQRIFAGDYQTIGFVQGNGTSTKSHSYSFTDKNVQDGKYYYRLKQVDLNGASGYSSTVEVNVVMPRVYSLEQNYPNPFNPTTQINFSLAADSRVTLKIFNILGQEVTTLINKNFVAGTHTVSFNASNLTSGVYLYRIDAAGIDGENFTAIKKMILTK